MLLAVLLNHMVSIFIEIVNKKGKNIVIGVIYRPPKSDVREFLKDFNSIMNKTNIENKECYLLGDFNINLLNSAEVHNLTNQFIDSIYSSFLCPLIDNIFTNSFVESKSVNGLICADISDHIPIFHVHKVEPESLVKTKYENYVISNLQMNASTF